MEVLTFNELPQAIAGIAWEISEIKKLLASTLALTGPDPEQWFDIAELCNYLSDKPTKPTVYGWVHNGIIPCHKGAKKLRFLKSEIDTWLRAGRKQTISDAAAAADNFISNHKR